MVPLTQAPAATWREITAVFCDIDDTLTTDGRITADVLAIMEALRGVGIAVIPVTGRPAGWCDMIARTWPVDAVVGENGAFYFRHDPAARRMVREFADAGAERDDKRHRLQKIAGDVLRAVPMARIAADQAYRVSDMAIDFAEDTGPLAASEIARIVEIFEAGGATAKVSSIHVNAWFGDYDKLVMTRRVIAEVLGRDSARDEDRAGFVFVGDSPNDAPMFGFFPNAVGVANLVEFADRCEALPHWIASKPRGAGFVELGEILLVNRADRGAQRRSIPTMA